MQRHLADILKELKPKRAVFTTYTFNLAFFDAALLPAFPAAGGCDISVLVDAGELAATVRGNYSQDAGVRYVLAPVRAPGGGIFHPKLAFLETEDEHYLCVGSANLTPAGLSSQLECLEIVQCSKAPGISAQLSGFFADLAGMIEQTSPRAHAVLKAASARLDRLPTAPPSLDAEPALRLIHTLRTPAASQLVDMLADRGGGAQSLTVLAPFHSHGGEPVKALARMAGVKRLYVAHHLEAAFGEDWYPERTGYVSPLPPASSGSGGRLHAKIFEIKTASACLVMTGSVNATRQSLQTHRNVELSLARWCAKSPFEWRSAKPERYAPTEFPGSASADLRTEASLEMDGFIEGVVFPVPVAGALSWELHEAGRLHAEGTCKVGANGRFSFELAPPLSTDHVSLQLRVLCKEGEARAWVNDERSLRLVRSGAKSAARHRASDQGRLSGDFQYIAQLIMRAVDGVEIPSSWGNTRPGAGRDPTDEDGQQSHFSYETWRQSGVTRRSSPGKFTASAARHFLHRIYALLLPEEANDEDPAEEGGRSGATIVRGQTDKEVERRASRRSVADRKRSASVLPAEQEQIRKACQAAKEAFQRRSSKVRSVWDLALMISAYELHKLVEPRYPDVGPDEVARASRAIDPQHSIVGWVFALGRFPFDAPQRELVLPLACALACLAAIHDMAGRDDAALLRLPQLKSSVDSLAGEVLGADRFMALASEGLGEEIFLRLPARLQARARHGIPRLAVAPALDDAMFEELQELVRGSPPSLAGNTPQTSDFPAIAQVLSGKARPLNDIRVATDRMVLDGGCACGEHFAPDERSMLRYLRVARHPSSGAVRNAHLVVYPDDPRAFSKRMEELGDA